MFKALGRDAKRLARVAGFAALSLSETAFSRFTITRCRETAEYNRYVKASSSNVAHSCAQTNFKARSPTHPPYTLRTKPKDLHNLVLGATTELLDTVLLLLDVLAGLLDGILQASADEAVLRFELLERRRGCRRSNQTRWTYRHQTPCETRRWTRTSHRTRCTS